MTDTRENGIRRFFRRHHPGAARDLQGRGLRAAGRTGDMRCSSSRRTRPTASRSAGSSGPCIRSKGPAAPASSTRLRRSRTSWNRSSTRSGPGKMHGDQGDHQPDPCARGTRSRPCSTPTTRAATWTRRVPAEILAGVQKTAARQSVQARAGKSRRQRPREKGRRGRRCMTYRIRFKPSAGHLHPGNQPGQSAERTAGAGHLQGRRADGQPFPILRISTPRPAIPTGT